MATPILQSLLLADHIYRDQQTGKHIICGIFSTIFFTPTPTTPPAKAENPENGGNSGHSHEGGNANGGIAGLPIESRPGQPSSEAGHPPSRPQPIQNLVQAGSPYVYFSVTELKSRKTFEVRYVDLHENRVLFQAEVPIECDDPLKTIEVSMPLPRLPLVALEERVYALEIVCEGQMLGSHRVLARIAPGVAPSPPG